jgi:hypothetical protein
LREEILSNCLPKLATKNFSDNKEISTFLQVKISETSVIYLYFTDFVTLDTQLNTKDYYSKKAQKRIVSLSLSDKLF